MRALERWLPGVLVCVGLSAGCKPAVTGELPICAAEVAGGSAAEAEARVLAPEVWYAILLDGFDRQQMLAGAEPRDCTGALVTAPTLPPLDANQSAEPDGGAWTVAGCSIEDPETSELLPARPLTDADLVVAPGPGGTQLVWVQARHYADGDASGPVAVVEWTAAGVAVRALGRLRGPSQAARLRIEQTADQRLLIAEGDRCAGAGAGPCVRVVRVLPILDGRIATVPLVLADAPAGSERCLGEAAFALLERHSATLPDGRLRTFEIVRSLRFTASGAEIAEQVVIEDADPSQPESPAQLFRNAASARPLVYRDHSFATAASLWEDMLASYGSVAVEDGAPASPGG